MKQNTLFSSTAFKDTGQQLESKSIKELLWNYEYEPNWKGKPCVHRNLLIPELEFTYRGININTSCGYKGGCLTGILFEDAHINQSYIHI